MNFDSKQKFSIRKYSIGAASVLLGTVLFGVGLPSDSVQADEVSTDAVTSEATESTSDLLVTSSVETASTDVATLETAAPASVSTETAVAETSGQASPSVAVETTETVKSAVVADSASAETVVMPAPAKVSQPVSQDQVQTAKAEEKQELSTQVETPAAGTNAFRNGSQATSRVVSNWNGFVSALNDSNIQNITISGNIVASGDNGNTDNGRAGSVDRSLNINSKARAVTIQGRNESASLDLLSNTLKLTGDAWSLGFKNLKLATANSKGAVDLTATSGRNTVTFDNVAVTGTLYGGGGNTAVVIKGNTSSTVSDSYRAANGQLQHVQRNVGTAGHSQQRREANIHDAKSVTVAEGASLTLNRSSQGDAINLADSGSVVRVADRAGLTINMNTNNGTESARYHNAGIFMENGGNVVTGKDSRLVLNTSIGQGISLGMKRPADGITHLDRWGGYGTANAFKKNVSGGLTIGDNASFTFTGRDGLMFGNNTSFKTGNNAKVRFENKGRGVAIDFGDNSHVVFGKKSTNTFHSVGKGPKSGGGPSGSYNAYNYIGVNENGTITVDEYATFRVQMDNRGDNAWDDVVNLDSKSGRKDRALFQANKGSIVDIRDDNTNYYAELISVPLGNSTNTYFQFNNPLYVSFMRYTDSSGRSAGEITGKLPVTTPQGNNPEQIGHGNILYISNGAKNSGNRVEFNGPNGTRVNPGAGTYTVYSMNKDGRDVTSRDKQSSVWTDIQGGAMSIAGFKPGGKPEINPTMATSVRTGSSSGGVLATDKTYGIDPVTANRQNIWVSNGTSINPNAHHQNVIRYVYEDGTPVLDENGQAKVVVQSSDWNRTLEVAIDQDHFKKVLKNQSVANGDEFLAAYAKAQYVVRDVDGDGVGDTGWKLTGTKNSKATYDTVLSPELDGYKAEILSTNVPGLSTGSDASRVSVTFNPADIKDQIVVNQNGRRTVSETYWRNIVDKVELQNYETVVVYKLDKQKASVKYVNITDGKNTELAKDNLEGRGGETIDYSTASRIDGYRKQGYELISDGFSTASDKTFDKDASVDQEFTVDLKERILPVGPDDVKPKPDVPVTPEDPASWPKTVETLQPLRRKGTQTINYREVENGKEVLKPVKNKVTFERIAYINLVTGDIKYTSWRIAHTERMTDEEIAAEEASRVTASAVAPTRLTNTTEALSTVTSPVAAPVNTPVTAVGSAPSHSAVASETSTTRSNNTAAVISAPVAAPSVSARPVVAPATSTVASADRKPAVRLVTTAEAITAVQGPTTSVKPKATAKPAAAKPRLVRGQGSRRHR